MVNRVYLHSLILRCAAGICAQNQASIDLIIPVLFGNRLIPEKISCIVVQVKLNQSIQGVHSEFFRFIDPFSLHIFGPDCRAEDVLPIIRIVFSLGEEDSYLFHGPFDGDRADDDERSGTKHKMWGPAAEPEPPRLEGAASASRAARSHSGQPEDRGTGRDATPQAASGTRRVTRSHGDGAAAPRARGRGASTSTTHARSKRKAQRSDDSVNESHSETDARPSKESAAAKKKRKSAKDPSGKAFIAYDFWCAGLHHKVLGPVERERQESWKELLRVSTIGWDQIHAKKIKWGAELESRSADAASLPHPMHSQRFDSVAAKGGER